MVFKPQTFHDRPPLAEIQDPTQATLEARVAEALGRAASVDASQIAVTVVDGVVTLDGIVSASEEIDRVAEVALSVSGVTTLQNLVRATGTGDVS
jgi:osmotically-inducible protein OsmY